MAGPALWSTYFWAPRIDLLTLLLLAAAAIVLTRTPTTLTDNSRSMRTAIRQISA
jgi:hypothetical protein